MCNPHLTTHSLWLISQKELTCMFASPRTVRLLVDDTPPAQSGILPIAERGLAYYRQ